MRAFVSPVVVASLLVPVAALAQTQPNYDESSVPAYRLPDPLILADGRQVEDATTWIVERRPEILAQFQTQVYGIVPPSIVSPTFDVTSVDANALGGKAIRKQVTMSFVQASDGPRIHLLIYLPKNASVPVPVFLGLNFRGNHSISADPEIAISKAWMRPGPGVVDTKSTEQSRGASASRWPVEKILAAGFGLATAYYGDIDPDFDDGFSNGVHGLLENPGQRGRSSWGSIAAWAWGLSRAMDYLEQDVQVDARKIVVMGHSRLGKTALWAGAVDQRFAMVVSNNSGCGGAALSRRAFGETVERINSSFPHWFCDNFSQYSGMEDTLPVDQHMLIALIAPRPVYVASAVEDRWADPLGEFLSLVHADPVYHLLGEAGIGIESQPTVDRAVFQTNGYHVRSGKHDVTEFDWTCYLDFAARHFHSQPGN